MNCDSRHALVTGASTGIGRATALRLARDGFHVFATVRRPHDAESLRREARLIAGAPEPLTALLMDVTEAFRAMAARALARENAGSDPEVVAAVVSRAITGRHPRARYLAGKDARRLVTLAKLPPRARDVLLRKVLGQPPPGPMADRASTGPPAPAARLAQVGQR